MPCYDSPYPYESYRPRCRAQEILRHMRRHYARSRSGPPAVHPHVVLGSDLHCVTRRSAVRAMCRNTNPDFGQIILRCERISDTLHLFFPLVYTVVVNDADKRGKAVQGAQWQQITNTYLKLCVSYHEDPPAILTTEFGCFRYCIV